MQRNVSSVGLWLALSGGAACMTACGDDAIVLGLPMGGTSGYQQGVGHVDPDGPNGQGGRGGTLGVGGTAGSGGRAGGGRGGTASGAGGAGGKDNGGGGAADGGTGGAAEPDAGTGGTGVVVPACRVDQDCEDGNPCTTDRCDPTLGCVRGNAAIGAVCGSVAVTECSLADGCDGAGACRQNNVTAGVTCGSATINACTARDTCDGFGACGANNAADGAACATGHCSAGVCDCATLRVAAVPFSGTWSTLAPSGAVDFFNGSCIESSQPHPDYVIVFTAPVTGTYALNASGSPDSTLTVVTGACGTVEQACNDDRLDEEQPMRDSLIPSLALRAGDVVSIVVSEFGQNTPARGSGNVSIALVP